MRYTLSMTEPEQIENLKKALRDARSALYFCAEEFGRRNLGIEEDNVLDALIYVEAALDED